MDGDVPSPINPKEGCRFISRCLEAKEICHNVTPTLKEVDTGHFVACHEV